MKKIAVLRSPDDQLVFELNELNEVCLASDIELKEFDKSEPILAYAPDCVLVTSPQQPKLTPFPTYGLIHWPRDDYLSLPRFLRNILTYDGYLCFSPRLTIMLKDLLFGARKLDTEIVPFGLFPAARPYTAPAEPLDTSSFLIFEPDFTHSKFKSATYLLLEKFPKAKVATFSVDGVEKHNDRFIAISDLSELEANIKKTPIAVSLSGGDEQEGLIQSSLIKLIMSSAITITHETSLLKAHFKDTLYTIPGETCLSDLPRLIENKLADIKENITEAIEKSKQAQAIALTQFALNQQFDAFLAAHEKTKVNKGYCPNPNQAIEAKLPSVTYIMRTGGKHRPFLERALDCLVAQQYPDMRVIFVTHVKVPFINEIIEKYPSIQFKVLESIKSKRSEAIRDGMAAVETDLFGLFDDDDELFPNHVRSLVKTMTYHSNRDWRGEIGMVYSGSIHADDTYPVFERVEFQDNKLVNLKEKRAIEHFKYYSSALMSQHAWFMPNGWLARASLIDNELLEDPGLDTCEDLYFELQIAQRRQMAFSVEVTAIHHFHHLGNSTIDDSHKHLPDTQRIALRNFSRTFPMDALYDTGYNIVGRPSMHDPNQIAYQDFIVEVKSTVVNDQFYPFRHKPSLSQHGYQQNQGASKLLGVKGLVMLPIKMVKYAHRFITMDKYKRQYYLDKFNHSVKQYGLKTTLIRSFNFFADKNALGLIRVEAKNQRRRTQFGARMVTLFWNATQALFLKFGIRNSK